MKKQPNIIWFHLDGVRPNKDFGDHKDRPDYLDKLAAQGIEYTNAYTTFASTVMSMSSVMFGYSPLYYSKCFEEIDINTKKFKPLFSILKENGYDVNSILFYLPARNLLKNVMFPINPKYYSSNVKDYDYMWNSKKINSTVKKFLSKKKFKKPHLLYLQYCFTPIPGDDSLNDVRKILNYFKTREYFQDSIIIIWADHGWPSSDKQARRTRMQKTLEGHDIFVTNENIRVPLILIYPGCKKGLKINTPVSTLDIGKTLIQLLGIKSNFGGNYCSRSLPTRNLKTNRIFRLDTRNYFQKGRKTVLFNKDYKLVVYFNGESNPEFYDLRLDLKEAKNVYYEKKYSETIKVFEKELELTEDNLLNFQIDYLVDKIRPKLLSLKPRKVLIVKSNNKLFNKVLLMGFKKVFQFSDTILSSKENYIKDNFDLIILPLTNKFNPPKIIGKKYYYVDYNFNLSKKSRIYTYIIEKFKKNWKTYLTQPKIFLRWLIVIYLRAYGKLI